MFELHAQLAADTITLGSLPLSAVLLVDDTQFPWVILVPRQADISEIYQLSQADQAQLFSESQSIAKTMMAHFQGDKFNFAALGNMVPQLHLHHIVRFKHDVAWPKPVWGAVTSIPYQKNQLAEMKSQLQLTFNEQLAGFTPC